MLKVPDMSEIIALERNRYFTGCDIDGETGERRTFLEGVLHSYDDHPSKLFSSKLETHQKWHKTGVLHRENGPAVVTITELGEQCMYYIDGLLHREDGPAYEADIYTMWFYHGAVHRLFYPAHFTSGGEKLWYHNGTDISVEVLEWAKEFDIELDNLTEDDKVLYLMRFGNVV